MFGCCRAILSFGALEKNSAMNFRMQRFHPAAKHFRPARQI